jgi:hypothetical protein
MVLSVDRSKFIGPQLVVDDAQVIAVEHEHIAVRRARRSSHAEAEGSVPVKAIATDEKMRQMDYSGAFDTIGLALSGGGIRSAAFSTGAMQALAKHNVYEKLDYLSTVSGGGYCGINTSIASARGKPFPFFHEDEKKDTPAMAVLRNNANYLKAGRFWPTLANLAIFLRGIAANILIVVPWLLLLAAITLWFNPTVGLLYSTDFLGIPIENATPHFAVTVFMLTLALGVFVLWSLSIRYLVDSGVRDWRVASAVFLLLLTGFTAFIELQPFVLTQMISPAPKPEVAQCALADMRIQCLDSTPGNSALCDKDKILFTCNRNPGAQGTVTEQGTKNLLTPLIAFFSAISAVMTILSSTLGKYFKEDEKKGGILGVLRSFLQSRFLWWLAAAALPLVFWLSYLLLVYWGLRTGDSVTSGPTKLPVIAQLTASLPYSLGHVAMLYAVPGVLLFILSRTLTGNGNSPHRLYRERLGEAFCFAMEKDLDKDDVRMSDQSDLPVSQLVGVGPYHLINTALNIGGDPAVNKRGRNADFFLLSKLFVGSKSTGYIATEQLDKRTGQTLDVATAMAVSGAALSSNMGSATVQLLRLTLAFFNVRLGYWFPNPKRYTNERIKKIRLYFLDEILGRLTANANIVYLSDGGHIENLGLYELLRRRCQLIIVVDAEADSDMTFGALVTAQRYARIDLGVKIDLSWSGIAKRSLTAQKADGSSTAGPHCAIGTIEYEKGGKGYLLYVKASVTGDENDYVRDYNRRFSSFPHQTTGDQFFSEEQFEAYRALGFHAVDGVLTGTHAFENNKGGLEYLTDSKATGEGANSVAEILGIVQTAVDRPPPDPTIHMIKLVSEAAQPFPLHVLMTKPPPKKRGRKTKSTSR